MITQGLFGYISLSDAITHLAENHCADRGHGSATTGFSFEFADIANPDSRAPYTPVQRDPPNPRKPWQRWIAGPIAFVWVTNSVQDRWAVGAELLRACLERGELAAVDWQDQPVLETFWHGASIDRLTGSAFKRDPDSSDSYPSPVGLWRKGLMINRQAFFTRWPKREKSAAQMSELAAPHSASHAAPGVNPARRGQRPITEADAERIIQDLRAKRGGRFPNSKEAEAAAEKEFAKSRSTIRAKLRELKANAGLRTSRGHPGRPT